MDQNRIKGAVRNVDGKFEDAIGGIADDIRTKIEVSAAPIADRVSSFVKQAAAAGENGAAALQDAAQKAGAQASDMGERLYDEGRRAGHSIGRAVEEQPLAAVLVAAALGYGIAYLVHRR